MGNCLKGEFSSTVWAGDDWCSINIGHDDIDEQYAEDCSDDFSSTCNTECKRLIDDVEDMFTSSSSSSYLSSHSNSRVLKIRISRRKLEQLLSTAERLGLTAEQFINRLMHANETRERKLQHSWCPNLQSIPEMN